MSLNRPLWHQPLIDDVSTLFRLQQEWLRVSLGPFYLSIPTVLRMDPSLNVAIMGDCINRACAMADVFGQISRATAPVHQKDGALKKEGHSDVNQISRSGPRFER